MNANNVIAITGRLTHNPDYRQTDNGTAICRFSVAVDSGKDSVIFVDCKAWRGTADFVERYFTKGKWITVCGSLEKEEWDGKDGTRKSRFIINVENVAFCGAREEQPQTVNVPRNEDGTIDIEVDEEDLPF